MMDKQLNANARLYFIVCRRLHLLGKMNALV